MKILFLADGRSMIALNWVQYFVEQGHEVHLVSLFPARPDLHLESFHFLPVALSRAVVVGGSSREAKPSFANQALRTLATPRFRTTLRHWLVPLSLPRAARQFSDLLRLAKPDLVHAMRIPYEGMVAARARRSVPLLVSIWGNDFTLHGTSTPTMRGNTRLAVEQADALHTDCHRDLRLAVEWGFPENRPAIVLPGGGGVQRGIFFPDETRGSSPPAGEGFTVINPRGLRAYINNRAFFQAIPLVLKHYPNTRFLCPAMAGAVQPEKWIAEFEIAHAVTLLPRQTRPALADLFRQSQVVVSPSTHDGTPNTLLEALACGCFPIAGDLESIREWITPGENGLLVDPNSPQSLAVAICRSLEDDALREQAQARNLAIIQERAEYRSVMASAAAFYTRLVA